MNRINISKLKKNLQKYTHLKILLHHAVADNNKVVVAAFNTITPNIVSCAPDGSVRAYLHSESNDKFI